MSISSWQALALAVLALGLRQWWTAGLSALIVAASFSVVWPHMHLPPADLQPQAGPVVRLLWANLHHRNTDLDALRRLIEAEKPDIAVFTELDPVHDAVLRDVRALLPFQSPPPRGSVLGVMLLARKQPESLKFDLTMGDDAPLMVARLCPAESGCLTLLGLHAWPPLPPWTGARDRQLAHAATVARQHVDKGERVVLVGDLNVTPFSPVFDRLLAQSGLWDTNILPAERPRTSPLHLDLVAGKYRARPAHRPCARQRRHRDRQPPHRARHRQRPPSADPGSEDRALTYGPDLRLGVRRGRSGGRAPNRALPTRTWVAPSRTAVS